MFSLEYSEEAENKIKELKNKPSLEKRWKAVKKSLRFLMENPRHPSLKTHEYTEFSRKYGLKIFQAYAENNTPRAYRIFFYYKNNRTLHIVDITPHPEM